MRGNDVSLVRAIRGPITLITLGVLFALNNFTPYEFNRTWPVLLIVFGLLSLLRRSMAPVPPPYTAATPYSYPAPPPPPPTSGGYRESAYTDAGPAKGGFGSSAGSGQPSPNQPGDNPGGNV